MHEEDCPNCGSTITLLFVPPVGTQVRCSDCAWKLEVISTDPFDVDFPLDCWNVDEDGDDGDEADGSPDWN